MSHLELARHTAHKYLRMSQVGIWWDMLHTSSLLLDMDSGQVAFYLRMSHWKKSVLIAHILFYFQDESRHARHWRKTLCTSSLQFQNESCQVPYSENEWLSNALLFKNESLWKVCRDCTGSLIVENESCHNRSWRDKSSLCVMSRGLLWSGYGQ